MTDELEPTLNDPTPDDATSRVPTPAASPTPTPAAPPTAPLTPANQTTSTPPAFEHEVAWASGPVPASPVVPPARRRVAAVASAGRSASRSSRWSSLASAAVAALVTGQSATSTVLGYVPAGDHGVRRGPPRPARRPARRHRRVPVEVPGLRRPGRPRLQARRGPRPAGQGRDQRRTVLHRRTSSRGSTASSPSAWGRCRPRRRSRQGRPVGPRHVPGARPPVDQGPGAGPGVVRRGDRQDRRQDDAPRPTTARP